MTPSGTLIGAARYRAARLASGGDHLGSRRCPRPAATWSSRRPTPIPSARSRSAASSAPRTAASSSSATRTSASREGRLKLREETPGGAALIQYHRSDRPEARESRYRIAPVQDGAALREALDAALGTLVVVDKERRLLLWEGVRIHLDTVAGLGSFLELEGVAPADSDLSAERDRVARLSEALGLDESRILADSYSDRVLARAGSEALIAAARGVHGAGVRAVLQASASASRCARPTARSTSAPTSRTPPSRSATAPRRPRSAR